MSRLILLICAFFILAFAPKDEDYFRQNLDAANELVKNRCHDYLSAPSRMDQTFKDIECDAAAKVLEENVETKSRETLILAIERFLQSLPKEDSYSEDEKLRYVIYGKNFRDSPDKAEELIISCMEDKDKTKQSKPECRASAESMLSKLNLEKQGYLSKIGSKEKYIDTFKKNPQQADELINGRCKAVLQNPWYKFDPELKDNECEVAFSFKQSILSQALNKKNKIIKGREYFRKNILEATEYTQNCKNKNLELNEQECSAAAKVIKEQEEEKRNISEYKKYFAQNVLEAKKVARDCGFKVNLSGDESVKCNVALQIVNEYLQNLKNNKKKEHYKENFRNNIEDAKKTIEAGCIENVIECSAAEEILAEDNALKIRDNLIVELGAILEKNNSNEKLSKKNKALYDIYEKHFTTNKSEAEKVATVCIKDENRSGHNEIECLAATASFLSILKNQKKSEEEKKELALKEAAQSQKHSAKKTEQINKLLNGRCKDVFADSWYKLDPDLQDKECNAALEISKHNLAAKNENKTIQQYKVVKNRSYFMNNLDDAGKISTQCKKGIVLDVAECDSSISVITERNVEENKKAEYQLYYKTHPLAAKFQVKWCKSSMLNFNIKCQAAETAIKNNEGKKPKIYNEELLAKNINKLKGDLLRVKSLLSGKCKPIMEDSWYYLDESLRSEECDAAAEIAKFAIEQKDKKQAADK